MDAVIHNVNTAVCKVEESTRWQALGRSKTLR